MPTESSRDGEACLMPQGFGRLTAGPQAIGAQQRTRFRSQRRKTALPRAPSGRGFGGAPRISPTELGVAGRREIISWQGDLGEDGPVRLPLSRAGPSYCCGVIIRVVARRFPERMQCHPENYLNPGGRTTRSKMAPRRSRGLGARDEIAYRGLSVNFQVPSGGIQDAVSAARLPLSSDRRFSASCKRRLAKACG